MKIQKYLHKIYLETYAVYTSIYMLIDDARMLWNANLLKRFFTNIAFFSFKHNIFAQNYIAFSVVV